MATAKDSASAHPSRDDVGERIRRDAAAHPERTYREHVAAAEEIAAEEYRAEIRRMMTADTLDPDDGEL